MTDLQTRPAPAIKPEPATAAASTNEGIRWLRRHLAWEKTIQDCVERSLEAKLDAVD